MLLRVYNNLFLRNHTGKVVPRVLPSCWKLSRFRPNPTWCTSRRGLKTIWGNFQTAASDSYFWKKRNDWVSYKTTTTNLNRNHMAYLTLFHAVGTQCLVAVFLPLVCFLPVFFPWTFSSMRRTLFFELDHASMSGRFSVWIMWTGNCSDVLRSAETFQSLAPFSSIMLGFFCFLTGHSPSLRNWIMGSLAVMDCWFAVSHCVLNNSIITSNTLLCHHVYIWSECGHADKTWRKVPRSLLHDKHRSELVYPHNFRLVRDHK